MDLNIVGFGYLFLRLAPFVLASFFTLASIFNQDFKGFVYLVGLLFSSFVTMLASKLPFINKLKRPENSPEICNVLTIGQSDSISDLPLGQSALAYTFAYLLFSILKYKMVLQNIPTLVFFPLLLTFDFIWNLNNSCYSFFQLLVSLFSSLYKRYWCNSSTLRIPAERRGSRTFAPLNYDTRGLHLWLFLTQQSVRLNQT